MKFSNVYLDRSQLAGKLGVEESQIAIAKVESNLNDVTITVAVDENANPNIDAVTMIRGESNARRFKLVEDVDGLKKQIVDLQTQVLQLQQEKAKLEQDLIKVHLESVEGVRDKFKKEVKLDPALCFLKALTQINNEIEKHMNKKDDYWTGN